MKQGIPAQISIELPDDVSDGIYSNFVIILSSPAEFVVDFARLVPGKNKAKINSRIIMPPQTAKRLIKLLEERVKDFEDKFGAIKTDEPEKNVMGFNNV
ncbi:DUF3467 domain-containing protein [candidate division WOR-3 bacterium]|nr:DUF3467 domain-containing protein [candidate division WOR-3 bacterium]